MSRNTNSPKAADATPLSAVTTVGTHGDDPMTEKQAAILRALSDEAGEPFDASLDRQQAEDRIAYLREETGRAEE
ncbi:Protein of unknown function [Tranquillimonas rosea]|uniref:DUF3072 domain-containing protein n=1 Tax=Tranquillimonas rosea TaxID=641238 RepID=A0A1H9UU83_9RHOB|nr:DUF3072 domain-containing protein [Tranquillimonas rosea]SES13035.1 Protein of unknown function [Tranquillimonas rosea]